MASYDDIFGKVAKSMGTMNKGLSQAADINARADIARSGQRYGLLKEVLGNLIAGGITAPIGAVLGAATQSVQTPVSPSLTSSKYSVPLADVVGAEQAIAKENYNRYLLNLAGADLPYLDPQQIIEENVNRNRLLMAEAGERERALESVRQEGAIQQSLANQLGNLATDKFLSDAIARVSEASRPTAEEARSLSEIARAF